MIVTALTVYQRNLPLTRPYRLCLGTWARQDMLTVDPAPGRGARNHNGRLAAPDEDWLGDPVAVYR